MQTHLQKLLNEVGIPAEDITAIDAVPETDQANFDPKPIVEKVKSNYGKIFKNDPQFFSDITVDTLPAETKKKLESSQYARAIHIVRDKFLKGIGMTEADYSDLPEDVKDKFELFVPAVAEKWVKSKSGAKEIQDQLIEARKKLESYDGLEQRVRTEAMSEAEQKINSVILNATILGELSSLPELAISASDLAKTAQEILLSKYGYERIGDFGIELRQKGNPSMKVLKNNSHNELSIREALQEIAQERGWLKKEATPQQKPITVPIKPTNEGLTMAPHIADKISRKIAAEK